MNRKSLRYKSAVFLHRLISGEVFSLRGGALLEKWQEAVGSILPIVLIMLILCALAVPMPHDVLLSFLLGAFLIVFGMGFFNLGTELAMSPIGEAIGGALTKSRNTKLILGTGFLVGLAVTMSEPDLTVLASQVPGIPNLVLIFGVALGVGLFLMLALTRVLYGLKMRTLLVVIYGVVFALAALVPTNFLPVAFDSGGVTTGPMTVPFILALGVGVATIRQDSGAGKDSFGLVALCSAGPILTVMLMGMIFRPEESGAQTVSVVSSNNTVDMVHAFMGQMPEFLKEVGIALLPIVAFFIVFQVIFLHLPMQPVRRIMAGLVYTFEGLVIFLLGANVGFMPAGSILGQFLGQDWPMLLVPIGMLIGWFTVSAEPAVQVLCEQVYDMTAGAIPKKALSLSLSIGVSASVGLSMYRILSGTPIMYFLVPGYALAIILSFLVPPVFTSIAFDSGGVASGPMTATFLLPFAMGACQALGRGSDAAFGIVSMVAMTPLIAIQVLGLAFSKRRKTGAELVLEEEIIEL